LWLTTIAWGQASYVQRVSREGRDGITRAGDLTNALVCCRVDIREEFGVPIPFPGNDTRASRRSCTPTVLSLLTTGLENVEALRESLVQALNRCPRQDPPPSSIHFDSAMEGVLVTAAQQAKKKGDAFLAADAIVLHLMDIASVASACRQAGLAPDKVRGS